MSRTWSREMMFVVDKIYGADEIVSFGVGCLEASLSWVIVRTLSNCKLYLIDSLLVAVSN